MGRLKRVQDWQHQRRGLFSAPAAPLHTIQETLSIAKVHDDEWLRPFKADCMKGDNIGVRESVHRRRLILESLEDFSPMAEVLVEHLDGTQDPGLPISPLVYGCHASRTKRLKHIIALVGEWLLSQARPLRAA